jgi:hypothetical protein
MGLFSNWWRKRAPDTFSERELDFNRTSLQKTIVKSSEALHAYRHDASHKLFADYLRHVLNLEILQLSEGKLEAEDFAYRRGRIDGIRHALNLREKFILDTDTIRKSKDPAPDNHGAKRSFIRPVQPTTAAGLSI